MAGGSPQAGIKPIHPFRRAKRRNTAKAVAPEHSYHCYGRAVDWVNIIDLDGGDKALGWDDNKAYAKSETIANQFEIRGIGSSDNDHLQDAKFARYADLPQSELGKLPGAMVA